MKRTLSLITRRAPVREVFVFVDFLALTVVMTWPWVTHLRDAASDPGDPYLNSWILWWDFHQTFHHPLSLFHANIFYPYKYTLAFSENNYGIALIFFPLFALGLRPLTIHGVATFLGFAFCGYSAFRLARTLTGSLAVAWIAGITFAFIPYRFEQLPHLNYLFAGWIPLLLEALVLFTRERSRKHAVWLGVVFFLNGLTCIHWFLLTLIPLLLSAVLLLIRGRQWRDTAFWRRGPIAVAIGGLGLLPFLLPYSRAAQLYGFVRNPAEALFYSATPIDWLVGDNRSKMWHRLNESLRRPEKELFPGMLPLLFTGAAVFLSKAGRALDPEPWSRSKIVILLLDTTLIVCGILLITVPGFGYFKFRLFGPYLFQIHQTNGIWGCFFAALILRMFVRYPEFLRSGSERNILSSLRSTKRSDTFWLGLLWTATGFMGSLGMNFYLHRFLYEYVPVFRSIRVPARWAMIAYLGLALLVGLGVKEIASLVHRHWPRIRPVAIYVLIGFAILIEQRVAPLTLIHGAVDPDELTLWFKQTPMAGGIVEVPTTIGKDENYLYTLRAADHGRPLVTAVSGFSPPIQIELQSLTHEEIIPDRFIDLLESIPCSYLVVHNAFLEPANRLAFESVLARGIALNRVRFIRSYEGEDLYAILKTEPNAKSESQPPFPIPASAPEGTTPAMLKEAAPNPIDDAQVFVRAQYLDFLEREPDAAGWNYWTSEIQRCGNEAKCLTAQREKVAYAFFDGKESQNSGSFVYRLYKAALGRAPTYQEFKSDRAKLVGNPDLKDAKRAFTESWVKRSQFTRLYPSALTAEQLIDALLNNIRATSDTTLDYLKPKLLAEFGNQGGRAKIVQGLADDEDFSRSENERTLVYMQYFSCLKRDPEPGGVSFWLEQIASNHDGDYHRIVGSFIESTEYRLRFLQPAKQGNQH